MEYSDYDLSETDEEISEDESDNETEEDEQIEPDDLICIQCRGSGEGQTDGSTCHSCNGSGITGGW